MSIEPNYSYIEPQALSDALTEAPNKDKRDFIIVDVRGDDFAGGHIPGCVNIPSGTFNHPEVLKNLYEAHKDKSTFVFHCGQSRVRGPTCANAFSDHIAKSMPLESRPQVKVLRGGFEDWSRLYDGEDGKIEI